MLIVFFSLRGKSAAANHQMAECRRLEPGLHNDQRLIFLALRKMHGTCALANG